MKLRVIANGGYYRLEVKSAWYTSWWHTRTYDDKDMAIHAFLEHIARARKHKEEKRKIVIAQEKV